MRLIVGAAELLHHVHVVHFGVGGVQTVLGGLLGGPQEGHGDVGILGGVGARAGGPCGGGLQLAEEGGPPGVGGEVGLR